MVALQKYCPCSALVTFVIVNLLDDTVILEVAFTTKPSLIHENEGAGFPSASHAKVTFSPSFLVADCGGVVISGWTAVIRSYFVVNQKVKLDRIV